MKQQKLTKKAAAYLERIENCTDRNEIEGMVLYNAQQTKRTEIRSKR